MCLRGRYTNYPNKIINLNLLRSLKMDPTLYKSRIIELLFDIYKQLLLSVWLEAAVWVEVDLSEHWEQSQQDKETEAVSCNFLSQNVWTWNVLENILLGRKQDPSKSSIFLGVSYSTFYVSSTTLLFIFHFFLYWLTSENDELNHKTHSSSLLQI